MTYPANTVAQLAVGPNPDGVAMTYPVRTTASLMVDLIIYATYLGFCSFVLTVFFIVFALGGYRLSRTDPQLAEVVQKTEQHHAEQRNGHLRTWVVNWVDLKLVTDAGETVRFGLSPSDAAFETLTSGQRVLVRFNRINPLSSVLDSDFNAGVLWGAPATLASLAIATLVCSFLLIAWGQRKARRWIRARDFGAVRKAVIIEHETSIWHGSRGTIGMSAVWRDETGRFGRSFWRQVYRRGDPGKVLPPIGESIRIYVDPVAPDLSVWEGDVGTRLGGGHGLSA